jgi:acetylornithine aminotransferase
LKEGRGSLLVDEDGRQYVDMSSGIAVNCLGHGNEQWQRALESQSRRLAHASNLYHHEAGVELAERLVKSSKRNLSRVFFANSGTEANEAALKFAVKAKPGRSRFVAFKGGFHGRTCGALSVTYKPAIREPFEPLLPGARFAPYNGSLDALRAVIDESVRAVIVEPIQGEGGVVPAHRQFLAAVRQVSREVGALMIADEVQCGLGRTGHLYAHEQYANVDPDMMTLAKPLAGGLPIGAVLCAQHVSDAIAAGDHGSTFAGNPLVCAVASATLDVLSTPEFLARVRALGAHAYAALKSMRGVTAVRSSIDNDGLLIGVDIGELPPSDVVSAAERLGALFITAGVATIRICPPLVISNEELDQGLDILQQAIDEVASKQ